MAEAVNDEKRALRTDLRARRNAMSGAERGELAVKLGRQLKRLVTERGARRISCFLSTPTEPDVRPFLQWASENQIEVLFPVTREDGLLDWTVGERGTELVGVYGMPEPAGELLGPMAVGSVDLMLIPAAAVDRSGYRLGWGRGFYDRTLGSMQHAPPVFAVLFDHEILESVPRDLHDQPVDGVVTPNTTLTLPKR